MDCRESAKEIPKWAYRNPNGLQPQVAFAEDYASPGHLHYNVPPLHIKTRGSFPPYASTVRWHGYTEAKIFFTQQPMPSSSVLPLVGVYSPHYCKNKAILKNQNGPCESTRATAKLNGNAMISVASNYMDPSEYQFSQSQTGRFDDCKHICQEKFC